MTCLMTCHVTCVARTNVIKYIMNYRSKVKLTHPENADLAFLYGTILTDGLDDMSHDSSVNLCIFADCQVDRSPTGSGVTARLAVQYHKGLIKPGRWACLTR